jgi:hypothetical protein
VQKGCLLCRTDYMCKAGVPPLFFASADSKELSIGGIHKPILKELQGLFVAKNVIRAEGGSPFVNPPV